MTERVKLAADSMKNRTLEKLLKDDTEYQKKVIKTKEALRLFKELELTKEQRDVVEFLLVSEHEKRYDYNVNTYMAGMLDAYEILKMFDLTRE